ncbi:MAG: bifunctional metallophosphatase/5'-nucleotidase [Sphingomonadales bacterium]|nr:bifunctional metallophosphatase/5'-nucleotidase [Sphingomonadales bacterium]
MIRIPLARLWPALAAVLLTSCAAPMASRPGTSTPVTVGIVAINDFHGAIEAPQQSVQVTQPDGKVIQVPAGGAAWVASAIDTVRAKYANHLTVSAGDLIGGSQLNSALFLDEPTIGVMNRIGLDFNAVGNHEFDAGIEELKRKQTGGCLQHTVRKPCEVEPFKGAAFPFLAANVITADGHTLFPATALRSFGKGRERVTVGLIGLTLKGTEHLVSPEGLEGVHFADEAETINALVPQLKAQGADAIVLLIHQGGRTTGKPNPQGCEALWGDILPILDKLDTRIDVVVSGHTHWDYVCDYGKINPAKPFLLTSAGVFGELVTDISIQIDPRSHRVVGKQAHNVIVQSPGYPNVRGDIKNTDLYPRFEPRPDIAEYVARYVAAGKAFALRPVGTLAGPVERPNGDASRTGGALGSLIADAQLAASAGAGAQIDFMNAFGIRSPYHLVPAADGTLTFGQLYAVQPFNNTIVTQSMTGAEIKAALEQGFDDTEPVQVLAPSHGFFFSFDMSRPVGDRVVSMTLNGEPIDLGRDYRVTTNSFLAGGGDSFSEFAKQRDAVIGVPDVEALEAWLKAVPPRAVPSDLRYKDLRPDMTPPKPPTMNSQPLPAKP